MQVVAPHIGFCVKSSVDSHGLQSVVYLNLLYHKDVPEAVARPGAVLHDEPCTGHCNHDDSRWEISYVLGPPRSHRAKDGSLRSIYDFVFGVKTLRRAQSDEQFRLVLLQTCYRALQEKINTSLSKKFNIAKKYAFKGPPEHPKTLVTELTSQPCVEAKESAHTASNSPLTAADYTIARSAASDVGVFDYHVRISLPKLDTAADSSLHLTRSAVTFFAPGRYDLKIELGAHVTVDVASGSSVFDQISRVMHVRFRVTEGTQTGMQASNTEPVAHLQDSHGHSHAHDTTKHTEQADYTHALVAPPPFAPQMLKLRSADGTRFPCFCRQTIRSVTLVITTGVISGLVVARTDTTRLHFVLTASNREIRLELVLYRAVKPKTTSSISDANAVVVLEKVTPEFWPSLAPPLPAKTSSSLQF